MTHFHFKTLLPVLLHVEDRMNMAHGLESRIPFLDRPLVEFVERHFDRDKVGHQVLEFYRSLWSDHRRCSKSQDKQ